MKPKTIKIHQAYFGELKRSHGCLDSTINDSELKSSLNAFTDRPGAVPLGLEWSPYLSGSSFSNYYVFTKTFPDTKSSRAGMVFSHALIVSLEDLEYIDNLEFLFSKFVSTIPGKKDDKLFELDCKVQLFENKNLEEENLFPAYLQKIVTRIFNEKTPIAFSSNLDSFSDTLNRIWRGAPIFFRKKLKYRISFTPKDINEQHDLTLVQVQENFAYEWINYPIISSKENDLIDIPSHAERLFLGYSKENLFADFLDDLKIDLTKFSIFGNCDKAYNFYRGLNENDNPNLIRQLIRLIAKISPAPENGIGIKSAVLIRFQELINSGKESNIKALRNMDLSAFKDGEEKLGKSISKYILAVFENRFFFDEKSIAELFQLVKAENSAKWWIEVMKQSLQSTIVKVSEPVITNIWKLLKYSAEATSNVLSFIPSKKANEAALDKFFPTSLKENNAIIIQSNFKKRKWYLIHAKVLLAYLEDEKAISTQLELEKGLLLKDSIGVNYICSEIGSQNLLTICLKNNDKKLYEIIGKSISKNESLLSDFDLSKKGWLKIWAASLKHTKDLSFGVSDLKNIIHSVFNLMLKDGKIPTIVTNLISESDFADISLFENRQELWDKIPIKDKELFLSKTANGYVQHLVSDLEVDASVEEILVNKITSDVFMTNFLSVNRSKISEVLKMYNHFPKLKDSFLTDYITNYSKALSELESLQLGILIEKRGFEKSATQIFNKAKNGNSSFKVALNKCKELLELSLWEIMSYGYLFGKKLNREEMYSALQELVIDLYPQGPEQDDIWKRAGGDVSILMNNSDRRTQWRDAIYNLKNKRDENISANALLKKIQQESTNSKIPILLNYFK